MIREDMYGRVQVSVTVVKRKLDMERDARYGMREGGERIICWEILECWIIGL